MNEQENIESVQRQIKNVFYELPQYDYEHIFIDNASTDDTVKILKNIAKEDSRVKIIVNTRNFGHIRSPFYAMLQARGDAVVTFVSDLQDPPALIKDFVKKWEEGYKIVIGVKNESDENALMFFIRKLYYNLIKKFAEVEQIKNFNGFGLYDQRFIEELRKLDDPYPYFRGLICEIGYPIKTVPYEQPARKRGFTKNNFYTLYDMAILGITNHSKIPIRLATRNF